MTNNAIHSLILKKVHMLIIVYLKKGPSGWIMIVWFPHCYLFLKPSKCTTILVYSSTTTTTTTFKVSNFNEASNSWQHFVLKISFVNCNNSRELSSSPSFRPWENHTYNDTHDKNLKYLTFSWVVLNIINI
jgi:hypothetical protein